MKVKKLITAAVCLSIVVLAAVSCSDSSTSKADTSLPKDSSEPGSSSQEQSSESPVIVKAEPEPRVSQMENVKLLGRTYKSGEKLWLGLSGTGAEFEFTGKKLSVTMSGNDTDEDSLSRVGIYVDDELVKDVMLTSKSTAVDIEGKTDKSVNVKIIKLSEAQNSCCSIDNITVMEGTIVPTAEKAHKIEFIGDSMTCGYGVEDSDLTHNFSTASENCCKAFGVKTAKLLDADYSLVCYSGYGIVSGYSADGSKNTDDLVANYYEKYCYTAADGFDGIKPQTIAYDHGFQPDAIVINLGTNDSTYTGTDPQRLGEYTEKYVEFLKTVRSKNPKARIFCTLGIMGNTLYNAMNDAVQRYTMLTGDKNITSFELPVQDQMLDGIVVQGHPSEKTHSKDADIIAQKIKTDMGW